jgi:ssDNA-binding Zn-finger/Zn-ribbon topoisomerase 1
MANNNPGCLGFLFQLFGVKLKNTNKEVVESLPYAMRDDFLSPSEFAFYKILSLVIPKEFVIFTKVALKDIFFVTEKDRSKQSTYLNKISKKHVDFLVCNASSMKAVCGIELDDTSHARQDRMIRDEFVNEVFKTAGLPLIRYTNKRSYVLAEVEEKLQTIINPTKVETVSFQTSTIGEKIESNENSTMTPLCPKCHTPFVLRLAKSGKNVGKQFYGCSNYPKCREMLEMVSVNLGN